MKNHFRIFLLPVLILFFGISSGAAEVEWQPVASFNTDQAPIGAVFSNDGKRIFVLTETGDILIYTSSGQLEDIVRVGTHIDFIAPGPSENQLLIGSTGSKTLQTISLEFIQEIDTAGAPYQGLEDAPVVVAVFMDYQCPYCVRLKPLLEEVLEVNDGQVKIAYKQFPLKMHKSAGLAAAAALVAFEAGKFQELHNLMEDGYNTLDDDKILDMASSLGFDRDKFKEKIADPAVQNRIQQDVEEGRQAGVTGIPTVFINGRRLKKRSLEGFQEMIDRELESNK